MEYKELEEVIDELCHDYPPSSGDGLFRGLQEKFLDGIAACARILGFGRDTLFPGLGLFYNNDGFTKDPSPADKYFGRLVELFENWRGYPEGNIVLFHPFEVDYLRIRLPEYEESYFELTGAFEAKSIVIKKHINPYSVSSELGNLDHEPVLYVVAESLGWDDGKPVFELLVYGNGLKQEF